MGLPDRQGQKMRWGFWRRFYTVLAFGLENFAVHTNCRHINDVTSRHWALAWWLWQLSKVKLWAYGNGRWAYQITLLVCQSEDPLSTGLCALKLDDPSVDPHRDSRFTFDVFTPAEELVFFGFRVRLSVCAKYLNVSRYFFDGIPWRDGAWSKKVMDSTSPVHPFYLRSRGKMSRSARVCTLLSASPLVDAVVSDIKHGTLLFWTILYGSAQSCGLPDWLAVVQHVHLIVIIICSLDGNWHSTYLPTTAYRCCFHIRPLELFTTSVDCSGLISIGCETPSVILTFTTGYFWYGYSRCSAVSRQFAVHILTSISWWYIDLTHWMLTRIKQ